MAAPPEPAPDLPRKAFDQALRYWLRSARYHVGFEPGGGASDLDTPTDAVRGAVEKAAALLGGAVLPMAITGGASAEEALPALVPFLAHCDLLAYRVHLGSPTVVPVVYADGLGLDAARERLAHYKTLGQALVDFGLGFNGQGMGAGVSPLFVYFDPARYDAADGGTAVLEAGFSAPTPKAAALDEDRVTVQAVVVDVSGERLRTAEPARLNAVSRHATAWLKRALHTFNVRTEAFTPADLRTVVTLAQHFARAGA